MARFKDVLPSSQGWIHELSRAEVHPDAERLMNLGRSFEPQQLVEESTIDFLSELRDLLNEYARAFNALSENGTKYQEIKIYSVAQTAADFMIFRNQVKLVFTNTAHGVIQIAFAQHARSTLSVNGQAQSEGAAANPALAGMSQDLLAQVGPFRDVYWTFQGQRVEPEQVAKFYFTEFARITRDGNRSRAGDKALIEQIKALLQEKGLDL
jgi:hypothetical protein